MHTYSLPVLRTDDLFTPNQHSHSFYTKPTQSEHWKTAYYKPDNYSITQLFYYILKNYSLKFD